MERGYARTCHKIILYYGVPDQSLARALFRRSIVAAIPHTSGLNVGPTLQYQGFMLLPGIAFATFLRVSTDVKSMDQSDICR